MVQEIGSYLELENISVQQIRAEQYSKKVDFVVSRAVSQMESFVPWVKSNISTKSNHKLKNGILYFNPGESAGMQKGSNAIGILDLINLEAKRIFF